MFASIYDSKLDTVLP